MAVITISREFGSGGRVIGEEIAKRLGYYYLDKDIIAHIRNICYGKIVIAIEIFIFLSKS